MIISRFIHVAGHGIISSLFMAVQYSIIAIYIEIYMGFPGSSAGKESVCNAGDPSLIYGSESSPEKG